ncbi:MAG: AIDA repeat-containing protein [Victivallales bacterium]|nr:AIDA repeat-containing protein [Victivallales bacterium]
MSEESQILVASGSGIQTVVPQLAATAPQIVYLDFDGAETSYYNPDLDIAIDNIVVEDSGFDSESITLIIDALNEQFGDDVVFTADLPTDTDAYSTIYVGVTSAFDGYGSFHGLAETIDSGNQIRDDNAFVFLNSAVATEFVTSVIAHETEHIVSGMEHGGEGLERYAHTYIIENGEKIGPGWLEDGDRMIIKDGGSAEHMQIFCGVNVSVCSGGFAYNTFLQNGASMSVDNGGIASYTTLEGMMSVNGMAVNTDGAGSMFVFGGGTATSTHLYTGGTLHVVNDGTANNTTVDGGTLYVDHFGTANNTTVSSGGTLYVDYDGRLKGSLQIASGATVSVESGAIMEFTVAEQENASIALFNHYDYLQGAENAIYTIIVKEDQAIGQYALADFASAFNETITVTVMTTSYTILGNLTVGSSFEHDSKLYHLLLDGNTLVLDIPDITPPVITLEGDTTTTLQSASLTASANEAADISFNTVSSEYDGAWTNYTGALTVTDNGTWYFKAIDAAGNIGTASITFNNIKSMGPEIELTGDNTTPLQSTTLTATTEEGVDIYYSPDGKFWAKYDGEIEITANCTWYFKATDAAGNTGTAQITFENIDTTAPILSNIDISAPNESGLAAITVEANETLSKLEYSWKEGEWLDASDGTISVAENGSVQFRLTDLAGNVSVTDSYVVEAFNAKVTTIETVTTDDGAVISWIDDGTAIWSKNYDIAIGSNAGIINLTNVLAGGVELLNTPSGEMAISVKPSQSDIWTDAGSVNVQNEHEATSQYIVAEDNGLADVIFASALFEWNGNYQAQHVGAGEWNGTGETAALAGKNAISDIFAGSDDASILLLTDDTNGDALFIEDIYSAFPEGFDAQARLAKIDEIRAGAGDDVIDLTSQRFDYVGGGMTVKGGLGDDVIWANNGDNTLFGDAGNDRIVGAGGNDVIVGGVGNDSMHGGGGEDIFAFGGDWGIDSVEQLENGKVTLWFDEGSIDKWDASTLTYRDGDKSVVVNGVAAENISLKFGDDGSEQYGKLLEMGAFDEFSSERIFENNNKRGTLA